jgi:hypothetical protein
MRSFVARAKYAFCCIALHMRRIQVHNSMTSEECQFFFDSATSDATSESADEADEVAEIGENDDIGNNSGHGLDDMNKDAFLAKLDDFLQNKGISTVQYKKYLIHIPPIFSPLRNGW